MPACFLHVSLAFGKTMLRNCVFYMCCSSRETNRDDALVDAYGSICVFYMFLSSRKTRACFPPLPLQLTARPLQLHPLPLQLPPLPRQLTALLLEITPRPLQLTALPRQLTALLGMG